MTTITAQDNQSLLDLVLLTTGTMEAAVEMATLNGMSLTEQPEPGTALFVPDAYVGTERPYQELQPATALSNKDLRLINSQ